MWTLFSVWLYLTRFLTWFQVLFVLGGDHASINARTHATLPKHHGKEIKIKKYKILTEQTIFIPAQLIAAQMSLLTLYLYTYIYICIYMILYSYTREKLQITLKYTGRIYTDILDAHPQTHSTMESKMYGWEVTVEVAVNLLGAFIFYLDTRGHWRAFWRRRADLRR